MSYVLVFSLQLKDQILYCTVTVLGLPANAPQTSPFGNFNFRVMGLDCKCVLTTQTPHGRRSWKRLIWDCRAVWDNKYQCRKPVAQLLLEAHPWILTHTHRYRCVIPKSLSTLAGSVETETCQCLTLKTCPFNMSSSDFSGCYPTWTKSFFFFMEFSAFINEYFINLVSHL